MAKLIWKTNVLCKLQNFFNYLHKSKELLIILREILELRNKTVDEILLKDYAIYIRDIRRFLRRLPSKTVDEIQVYIDDYQAIGRYAKIASSVFIDS